MQRIVIEGIDGSGKTTLAKALVKDLNGRPDTSAMYAPYPGDNPVGRFIRRCLQGEETLEPRSFFHLFLSDAVATEERIGRQATKDTIVVADRHPLVSAFVYQLDLWPFQDILWATRSAGLAKFDLLFILELDPKEAFTRCAGRGKYQDAVFQETLPRLQKYHHRYMDIARTPTLARDINRNRVLDGSAPVEQNVLCIRAEID